MDKIIEQAKKLGELIAEDSRAQNMRAAQQALASSQEDRMLLDSYQTQQQRILELEQQGKPVEPEDKRKLADLHDKVIANRVIKDLIKAQTEYIDLMTRVTREIETLSLGGAGSAGGESA